MIGMKLTQNNKKKLEDHQKMRKISIISERERTETCWQINRNTGGNFTEEEGRAGHS